MRILLSAYACEPGKGSEPGAGWAWALAAARNHDVCVVTRANNCERIEAELAARPVDGLRFVYLDLPPWARFWKRRQRGVRVYYALWQALAAREARRLHRAERFDAVHHVTFANLWLPALASLVPAPFVLGPVSGGQRAPLRLYRSLGPLALAEAALLAARALFRLNPLTRLTWSRARVIVVNNEETRLALPRRHRPRAVVRPNPCVLAQLPPPAETDELLAVCAGRLNRFKGVPVALRALADAPGWRLAVAGGGPDEPRLRRLAARLGVADRVTFAGPLAQEELWALLARSRALVLPSLKEGASFSAAEAQAVGVPVVAFDRGGPAALARLAGTSFELVPVAAEPEAARLFAAALARIAARPRPRPSPAFSLEALAADVDAFYRDAVAPPVVPEVQRA